MKLSIDEIIKATNGKVILNKCNFGKINISTDTRTIKSDEIYLPLAGENYNGHDFINAALKQGCIGYFIDKEHYEKAQNYYNPTKLIILVENTLEAYLKTANFIRNKVNPKVVAITGSSGKTTVKEMIYSVLSEKYKTHKSLLNHNNEIGFCQTLLCMEEDTEFLVTEMGMRGSGEIELLSKYAEPDFAVVTNVGTAHIGRLGSYENIAKAKCEIVKHLKKDGTLIAFDDEMLKKVCKWKGETVYYGKNYKIIEIKENLIKFMYDKNEYELPATGEYNIINALSAIEIGKLSGISTENIRNGLLKYQPVGERGKIINLEKNIKIIEDCYNANPDSMKASINSVISTYPDKKIILVLGDMGELGIFEDKMHSEIGDFLSDKSFSQLVTVGEKAKLIADSIKNKKVTVKTYSNNQEAADFLKKNAAENTVILLKASRFMKFEEISEILQKVKTKV